jgi:hypothetical protein
VQEATALKFFLDQGEELCAELARIEPPQGLVVDRDFDVSRA